VERSRNPRYVQHLSRKPADAGDSHGLNLNDHEMTNNKKLPPASRARKNTKNCGFVQSGIQSGNGQEMGASKQLA
jgi:hypothetical protein